MKIAIASGKGGTGKTFVSTNLFNILDDSAIYADCDVEEPNGHIFLKPQSILNTAVNIKVPVIDPDKCTLCGKCAQVCEYNAVIVGKKALVFDELCHGCGSCSHFCPENAITETDRTIGRIEKGYFNNKTVYTGFLNIGEPMAPPIIRAIMHKLNKENASDIILDSPPGTSCPMIETANHSDFVVLVTEPTPFGLHDLDLAVQVVKKINKPFGIVVNKSFSDNNIITEYCDNNNYKMLAQIPFEKEFAGAYSKGILISKDQKYHNLFSSIYNNIKGSII